VKGGVHPDVVGAAKRVLSSNLVEIAAMTFEVWMMVDKPWL